MPVVVIGADLPLGRGLVLALAERGVPDVRAVVAERGAAAALRAAGVRVAVGDLSDPVRLGAVLEDAYTVVHLARDPLDTWAWLLEAAEDTGLRRVVTVLPEGVEPPEGGAYEVVVVRGAIPGPGGVPTPGLVEALAEADSRR